MAIIEYHCGAACITVKAAPTEFRPLPDVVRGVKKRCGLFNEAPVVTLDPRRIAPETISIKLK